MSMSCTVDPKSLAEAVERVSGDDGWPRIARLRLDFSGGPGDRAARAVSPELGEGSEDCPVGL
jgi:hypothetical protein